MTLIEINDMIGYLVNYQDSDITHTLANKFEISYSKELSRFQISDIETGIVHRYEEIEKAALALFSMLHTNTTDI
ncbi:hypothetical protein [Priestia megaterium]|uniref:hypothetical protein n=1 Tax=Priestia megaterium TaxID=1404 RepID=UPI0002ED5555|nr:hypothetical protein [Priestia megaterium]MED3944674.1 hypothetical protein [Priestia megaterium]MED4219434.1 hypothetical protein [Priestia megaterium]WEZ37810.1 hypothetical protein P5636_21805 [Priestia megaterium DSM 319]